jgi:hypothetical protein
MDAQGLQTVVERLLDGEPLPGPLRAVPGNAIAHVGVGRPRGGDECGAPRSGATEGDGVAALAAPGTAEYEMRPMQ